MKVGAATILSTMVIGLAAWAGSNIFNNSKSIARLEERAKSNKELLLEIRQDVKEIKSVVR